VAEILSESTRRNDLLKKLNLYMTGGVQEYWVVDPKKKQLSIKLQKKLFPLRFQTSL